VGNSVYDAVRAWFLNDGARQTNGIPYPATNPPVAYPDYPTNQGGYIYINPALATEVLGRDAKWIAAAVARPDQNHGTDGTVDLSALLVEPGLNVRLHGRVPRLRCTGDRFRAPLGSDLPGNDPIRRSFFPVGMWLDRHSAEHNRKLCAGGEDVRRSVPATARTHSQTHNAG
jgi:hypothetical protein